MWTGAGGRTDGGNDEDNVGCRGLKGEGEGEDGEGHGQRGKGGQNDSRDACHQFSMTTAPCV